MHVLTTSDAVLYILSSALTIPVHVNTQQATPAAAAAHTSTTAVAAPSQLPATVTGLPLHTINTTVDYTSAVASLDSTCPISSVTDLLPTMASHAADTCSITPSASETVCTAWICTLIMYTTAMPVVDS
jgi:hypothetical protein